MHCKKIHVRIDGRMFSGISNLTGFLMDSSGTEYLQLFRGFYGICNTRGKTG